MPAEKDSTIQAISGYILNNHPEVLAAYFFGSFHSADSFRDIDLGLLLHDTPPQPLAYEIDMEIHLERRVGYPVDIRILNSAPISFCQAVIRGKLIFDANPDRRADFENRILKQYFDFSPFRRRYLAEVLNAPV